MIGWLREAILEKKKNDRTRKWDDVWVERKHILESEYANVKHRGLTYIGKFQPGILFGLKTATQSYSSLHLSRDRSY